jgi:hypothetical protein
MTEQTIDALVQEARDAADQLWDDYRNKRWVDRRDLLLRLCAALSAPAAPAETHRQRGNRLAREEAERRGISVDPRLEGHRGPSSPVPDASKAQTDETKADIAALRERAEKRLEEARNRLVFATGGSTITVSKKDLRADVQFYTDFVAALPSTGTGEPEHRYRHLKTGGTYKVIAHGKLEWSLAPVVIYEAEKDGTIWVRPEAEFFDGRFERIAALSSPTPEGKR